ncbi:low molecular weight protein-tyrosine-phosphatase [Halomonas getboli]|uniref:low molecular weight protein-tyrosine-phosphatase n=1 Tax=Halomonas getboli TaxID=2935862 RepID=UPI001FFF6A1F|nr:low molecular weight protein-tyrosine-phosphatase [Halomonas getboli]MCK2182992.1 low molecular weight phosphotyrosine protein phosphatase [Halomonas getboli]
MFHHLLVVCTGNICRSPVGEAMLKASLPDKNVESAGLGALVGQGVEPTARELAEAEGLDVAEHKARQISQDMLQRADLILVMSEGQRRAIGEMAPAALGKTMLIGRWLDGGKGVEIPDPYRKSREAFEHVHRMLKEATDSWVARV